MPPELGLLPDKGPSGELLLVSCSARKIRGRTRAANLYRGVLFRLALKYAKRNGLSVMILSAKYGFVHPDQILDYYNQKLEGPYEGPFPDGQGFYVGSALYFGNVPDRFRPLLPPGLSIGRMVGALKKLLVPPRESKRPR